MPVLRSREITSKAESKCMAKAIDIGGFEPETPIRSQEALNQQLNYSPPGSSPLVCKHTMVSGSGTTRRSSRLASKTRLELDAVAAEVKVSGLKRKRFYTQDNKDCITGFDLGLAESNSCCGGGNGPSNMEASEATANQVSVEVGSMSWSEVGEGAMEEKVKLINSGSLVDSLPSKCSENTIMTSEKGKRMREAVLKLESQGLENALQNANEKKFTILRSGKRIEITGLKRKSRKSSKVGENRHDDVCSEESGSKSSGLTCKNVTDDANSEQAEDVSIERSENCVLEEKDKKENVDEASIYSALGRSKLDLEAERPDESTRAIANGILLKSTIRSDKGELKSVLAAASESVNDLPYMSETSNNRETGSMISSPTVPVNINKGKEKLIIDERRVDTENGYLISTSILTGNDNKKGKEKLVVDDVLSKTIRMSGSTLEETAETRTGNAVSTSSIARGNLHYQGSENHTQKSSNDDKRLLKERFRDIAKRNASRFAHFHSLEGENNNNVHVPESEVSPLVATEETEDWPGPFSTAKKIIKDRQTNTNLQLQNSTLLKSESKSVVWIPKKDSKSNDKKRFVPSLLDICMLSIVENVDAVTSLDYVPDVLRHRLSDMLCNSRKMDNHFLGLLVSGSPTEIHVRECSWVTEEIFTRTFEGRDMRNLTVLQLDQCGASLPDYILSSTLAYSPNCLPSLTSLSLMGAYRLSDAGLSLLVASAPALRSINLSQCSLLTSDAIHCLASSLGPVLMEIYLDECQGIDAVSAFPAFLQFEKLEVLSLTNVTRVSDDFIIKFVHVRGHIVKELVLRNCIELTDSSVRAIAKYCPKLCTIDLANLSKLTDLALEYLANGCRAIHTLKFCRNGFSDEAVAAYLEICGEPLKELSLSNINMVAHNTATSLATHSKNLHSLDLSWCRKLTDEAFGLIVDSCPSLKMLKVFGCTQITDTFLSGYSNPDVQIIGLKMKPIMEHLNPPEYLQGPLRYSFVASA